MAYSNTWEVEMAFENPNMLTAMPQKLFTALKSAHM